MQTLFFMQKCDEESLGQVEGQMVLHLQLQYLVPLYQRQLLRYLNLVL